MSKIDETYHTLLEKILREGYEYNDPKRIGIKRLEIPSYTIRHEFKDGFPILTTKKINYNNVVTELIWFLRGDTNIKYLVDNGCNIWNKDAYNYLVKNYPASEGNIPSYKEVFNNYQHWNLDLGPIYGHQWRNFNGIDQISNLIKNLKEQPLATDHIVNSWNVGDLDKMALPPCHDYFQIVVRPMFETDKFKESLIKRNLPLYGFELHWHQRSVDTFLG